MAQKRPVAVDKRRKRIYTIRRIIVFVCALVCCVLAVFSTMGAMRAWPRPGSGNGNATPSQSAAKQSVTQPTSFVERQQVPVFNHAIQEQRNKEAQRARWSNPTGKQPNLSQYSNLSVDVSLAKQEVYVKSNGKTIYTMIASTGMDDVTPHGTYTISARGDHFYNASEGMGADYWVQFYGPYLFHSVPTGTNSGEYMEEEGNKLGSRPHMVACDSLWPMPNGSTTKFRKARRSPSPEAWPEIDTEAIVL